MGAQQRQVFLLIYSYRLFLCLFLRVRRTLMTWRRRSALTLHCISSFKFQTFLLAYLPSFSQLVTPIVTALRTSTPSSSNSSTRTSVIAGSAVAGLVVVIVVLATLFICRRRVQRQRYWALSRKRQPSRAAFLAGEEMDLPFPSPPFASAEYDDPLMSRASSRAGGRNAGSGFGGGGGGGVGSMGSVGDVGSGGGGGRGRPSYTHSTQSPSMSSNTHGGTSSSPPRLLRARASESGSIFHESVWPPPSAASQLIDPLTSPSQKVDLTRIVNDVMGPLRESEMGPLLLPIGPVPVAPPAPAPAAIPAVPAPTPGSEEVREQEEPERGEVGEGEGEGERGRGRGRGRGGAPLPLSLTLTNPDDWARPEESLYSSPSSPSLTPPPPLDPPLTRWLNRSPNSSPKGSPSHRPQAL